MKEKLFRFAALSTIYIRYAENAARATARVVARPPRRRPPDMVPGARINKIDLFIYAARGVGARLAPQIECRGRIGICINVRGGRGRRRRLRRQTDGRTDGGGRATGTHLERLLVHLVVHGVRRRGRSDAGSRHAGDAATRRRRAFYSGRRRRVAGAAGAVVESARQPRCRPAGAARSSWQRPGGAGGTVPPPPSLPFHISRRQQGAAALAD